ncbi:hemicentin-2-like [Ornithodoros turicata]|uniref:hemicentin-2-like n=1 Tax=Ornithodoros turicata TaxID=34597 RepID=UPI00313926D1
MQRACRTCFVRATPRTVLPVVLGYWTWVLPASALWMGFALVAASPVPDASASPGVPLVTGADGSHVRLPCVAAGSPSDDEPALVLWYREGDGAEATPRYSVDARRGSGGLAGGRHAMADGWAGRAYFNAVARVLELDPVRLQDEGRYRCRVDFRRGRTRTSHVMLTLTVAPHNLTITDGRGNLLQSLIGPYNEGDSVRFLCSAQGRPPPIVTWWRDAVLLDDSYESSPTPPNGVQGTSQNELVIPQLERHHLMALVTCTARCGDMEAKSSITLDMNFRPMGVQIRRMDTPLVAEASVHLECESWGSRPPPSMAWWKGSQQMTRSWDRLSVDGNLTTSVLAFTPGSEDHGKRLRCVTFNPHIPDSALEDHILLQVDFAPVVSVRLEGGGTAVQEGASALLHCSVRAQPPAEGPPVWLLDGRPTSPSRTGLLDNGTLLIRAVNRNDSGAYTCSAGNLHGSSQSPPLRITVLHTPICAPGQSTEYLAALDEPVSVHCKMIAEPKESSFSWTFNNSRGELVALVSFNTSGSESIARYVPRSPLDYGTLYCSATNRVGTTTDPCVFRVSTKDGAVYVPEPPVCRTVLRVGSGFRVLCQAGRAKGFLLEVRDSQGVLRRSLAADAPSFEVDDLPPGTSFVARAFALGPQGLSAPSEPLVLPPVPSTPSNPGARTSPWERPDVWGGVVAGFLLLVLTTTLAAIFVARRKRSDPDLKRKEAESLSEDDKTCPDVKGPDVVPGTRSLQVFTKC